MRRIFLETSFFRLLDAFYLLVYEAFTSVRAVKEEKDCFEPKRCLMLREIENLCDILPLTRPERHRTTKSSGKGVEIINYRRYKSVPFFTFLRNWYDDIASNQ